MVPQPVEVQAWAGEVVPIVAPGLVEYVVEQVVSLPVVPWGV